MPKKEYIVQFKNHQIRVVNTWFSGAKLYIDSDCKDSTNELSPSSKKPLLSASLQDGETRHIVEIYIKTFFTIKIKICVDGQQIAGDSF